MPNSTQYALSMIYVALTEAMSLSTGKPAGELSSYLLRGMINRDTPDDVRTLLESITRDCPATH